MHRAIIFLLLVGGLSATAALQEGTALANRSFENGADPAESIEVKPGSPAIEGWTVVGGSVNYVGRKWQPSQGTRSIALPCGSGISQMLKVEPDYDYEIRFSMAGDPAAAPARKALVVRFDGQEHTFTFDTTGRSAADMGWTTRSWVFRAQDASAELAFLSPKGECSVPAVDNVRIEAVEIGVRAVPDAPERTTPVLSGH
jgi:choice-of-anchor C domain-containing protein